MPRSTQFFIAFLVLLVVLLGYNYFFTPFAQWQTALEQVTQLQPSPSPTPTVKDQLLTTLTPRQKIYQLLAVPLTVSDQVTPASSSATETAGLDRLAYIQATRPGVVTLFGSNISTESAKLVTTAIASAPIPPIAATPDGVDAGQQVAATVLPLIAVDHEGGTVLRLSGAGFTKLPSWQQLCTQNETVMKVLLETSARQLKQVGVELIWGPVVDLATANPVLKSRICAGDPKVVTAKTKLAVAAYQQAGIFPVLKHFPGIGDTTKDLHLAFDQVAIDASEASVYREVLASYPAIGVMVAHVGVINQLPEIPCSLSWSCINQVTYNFPQVLVVSDALEMQSAAHLSAKDQELYGTSTKNLDQIAFEALLAGNHVLVFGPGTSTDQLEAVVDRLENEYNRDSVTRDQVDSALKKLWQLKTQLRSHQSSK